MTVHEVVAVEGGDGSDASLTDIVSRLTGRTRKTWTSPEMVVRLIEMGETFQLPDGEVLTALYDEDGAVYVRTSSGRISDRFEQRAGKAS